MSKVAPEPWRIVDAKTTKVGIRNDEGFICFMADVTRYPDQQERYIEELREQHATAQLIKTAPKLLRALKRLDSLVSFLALGSLESACKHGDDYQPPTQEECKEVYDFVQDTIAEAESHG